MADAHQPYLEERLQLGIAPGSGLKGAPTEASPSSLLLVHASTAQVGGAEASLLEILSRSDTKPVFLVPAEGPLTQAVSAKGWSWKVLPWPRGLASLTQSRWYALPAALPGLPGYLLRLHREFKSAGIIWSSGFKSHAACLLLTPWHGHRIRFDIRDFLRPKRIRSLIAGAARRFGSRVSANSAAVAADYPGAEVVYPVVKLVRDPVSKRRAAGEGRRIITHLAYFAPYKGQDLFLAYARKLLDAGVDAEFWVAGDVIYPADAYTRYRDDVYAIAGRLGLASRVRFLGKVEGKGAVQDLLEQTDLLIHCTREPEPFGRVVIEALMCGCEVVCHRGSGACEVTRHAGECPDWLKPLEGILDPEFIRVSLKPTAGVS